MADIIEEVVVRVVNGERLSVTGLGVNPLIPGADSIKARHARMCEIMAQAIGQDLALTFDSEENALKAAVRCTHVILARLSETLDTK